MTEIQKHHLQAPRLHLRHDHIPHRLLLSLREHDLWRFVSPTYLPKHIVLIQRTNNQHLTLSHSPPPSIPTPLNPHPTHPPNPTTQETQPTPAPPPQSSPTSSCSPTSSSSSTMTSPSAKQISLQASFSPAKAVRIGSGIKQSASLPKKVSMKYQEQSFFLSSLRKALQRLQMRLAVSKAHAFLHSSTSEASVLLAS